MTRPRLLVLCAIDADAPLRRCVGQSRFLGEAGLAMAGRGVVVLCAEPGADVGHRPVRGSWRTVPIERVDGVYDRHRDAPLPVLRDWERRGVPVVNPPALRALLDDKLGFARWAARRGVPVPTSVAADDPRWRRWPAAFAKPRRGWGGAVVRPIDPDDPTPGGGVVQRAVLPERDGESIRWLLQRVPGAGWRTAGVFARVAPPGHRVAGLARGARAEPLDPRRRSRLWPAVARLIAALEREPWRERIVEIGVDAVLARDGAWVIEANARPARSLQRIGRADLRRRADLHPFGALLRLIDDGPGR